MTEFVMSCRGERIVFSGPNTNTNTIWFQNFDPNTNTNTIRVQKFGRIQILFGVPLLSEYEYLVYSNNTEYEYK